MNRLFKPTLLIVLVILIAGLTACRPADDPSRKAVGKWETTYLTTSYGSVFTMRSTLQMRFNGTCLQRTYNTFSGILYEEYKCTFETKPNGTVWISYEDGRNRQIGFAGEKLVIFFLRTVAYDTGPHVKFAKLN